MKILCIYIILISIPFEVKCNCTTVAETSVLKLKDDLLCGYDKDKMPTNKKKQPVRITVMNIVKHVVWDTKKNSLKINCIVGTSWKNPSLSWAPSDYDSVKSIYMPADEIWKPVIEIVDVYGSKKLLDDSICQIRSSGFVACVASLMVKVMCRNNYGRYWPKDELDCSLVFSTIPYENNTLAIHHFTIPSTLDFNHNRSAHWKLKNVVKDELQTHVKNQIVYNLRTNFTFSRIAKGISAVTILPGVALSVMNLIIPYIKPTGNERLTVCFVNMFVHIIFLQHAWWTSPFIAETPMIYVFVAFSFFLAMVGLYIGIFIRSILVTEICMPPLWLIGFSRLTYTKYGKYLNIKKDMDLKIYVNLQTITKEEKTDRLLIKQILDRFFFITSTVVYSLLCFIVFCTYISGV